MFTKFPALVAGNVAWNTRIRSVTHAPTKFPPVLHKAFPFFCYASALVSLLLLLVSPVKLVTVKDSSIKAKSTKNAAKFSSFSLFILVLKRFTCLQNFPRLSRETLRGTHAFVLSRMLRQNSHLFDGPTFRSDTIDLYWKINIFHVFFQYKRRN